MAVLKCESNLTYLTHEVKTSAKGNTYAQVVLLQGTEIHKVMAKAELLNDLSILKQGDEVLGGFEIVYGVKYPQQTLISIVK